VKRCWDGCFFPARSAAGGNIRWRGKQGVVKEEQTSDALLQTSFLLLAADGSLEERVEDGMHPVRIARCASWARMGEGACDEGDATVECCGFF